MNPESKEPKEDQENLKEEFTNRILSLIDEYHRKGLIHEDRLSVLKEFAGIPEGKEQGEK